MKAFFPVARVTPFVMSAASYPGASDDAVIAAVSAKSRSRRGTPQEKHIVLDQAPLEAAQYGGSSRSARTS
jgi:hypothetical protein